MDGPAIITRPSSAVTHRRKKRAKLALVGRNPKLVKIGVILTDGRDDFAVEDEDKIKLGGPWFKLYNKALPEGKHHWFRLEDLEPLAVVL